MGFRQKLAARQKKVNSLLCVGLDPLLEKMPPCLKRKMFLSKDWERVAQWMTDIVDTTAPYACMFKPQKAHYEAIENGQKALSAIINYIHEFYPDIPPLVDCKRGDIDRTQECYRIAQLDIDGADGMNFNPYMGKDCMKSLVHPSTTGKALVGLCYTSNPAAREVQDVILASGEAYWEFIAAKTLSWAKELNVLDDAGLVMAAAHKHLTDPDKICFEHLVKCRGIVGQDMWFLIPGIGKQKGFLEETIKHAYAGPGTIAINSSSEINFASIERYYAFAAGAMAEKTVCEMRRYQTVV